MSPSSSPVRISVGDAAVLVLAALAGSSLAGALRGPGLWWAIAVGVLVVVAVTIVAERLNLLAFEWIALSLAGVVIFGAVVVTIAPTPSGYSTFIGGLISGWAEIVTSVPPTKANGVFRVPPYVLTTFSGTIGLVLLRRTRVVLLPALAPAILFGVGLLFSVEARATALIQGALMIATALFLGWWQQRQAGTLADQVIGNTTTAARRGRVLQAAAIVAAVSALAPAIAPVVDSLNDRDRFDLRDRLEPPWNPLDEPSPLAQIKANFSEDAKDEVVFVASRPGGAPVPRRWALATMASYDGLVWTVGDSAIRDRAEFKPIDEVAPLDPLDLERVAAPIAVEVELVNGNDGEQAIEWPWLPLPGRLHSISEPNGNGLLTDLRFNERTGTLAAPEGAAGQGYLARVTPFPDIPDDAQVTLVQADGELGLGEQAAAVRSRAADAVQGADRGWSEMIALSSWLRDGAYLDDENAAPGHSQARLQSFLEEERPTGNEEQYAATAGIFARNTGVPARVVVGWMIDPEKDLTGEVEVTRTEASAWIEVLSVEFGWVPVDVTPDRDEEPDLEERGTLPVDVAAPNPPVPPPPPPDLDADQDTDEEEEEEEEPVEEAGIPAWAIASAISLLFPLAVVAAWLASMMLLKSRRRSGRRNRTDPAERVAGAWFEANDRLREAGLRNSADLSVVEMAELIDLRFDGMTEMSRLARIVDESAFGPSHVSISRADEAWQHCDSLVGALQENSSTKERIRRISDPGSLLSREPQASTKGRQS